MEELWENINRDIPEILSNYQKIAVVGLSANRMKPSNGVGFYLKNAGYTLFPVNPNYEQILGLNCFNCLKDINGPIEIVDIFRKPEYVLPVVEEAIAIGAKVIWMQSGIVNEQAAQRALQAGLKVVMDRCMKIEHLRHGL